MKTVLVTGGAGFIGSHTCVELLNEGYDLVVVDNLCNSDACALDRVQEISGRTLDFVRADIRDSAALNDIFSRYSINAVVHFAGLKAVGESVAEPLKYFDNNVNGTVVLLQAMQRHEVFNIVFSSSATVYGDPASLPIKEDFPLAAVNPYGRTKLIIEQILFDLGKSDSRWQSVLLRYFNPVGAHPSGLIGEDPNDIPNNLMPFIAQVAIGRLQELSIYGGDYATPDGTGVRDYIHVVDLAKGHLAALSHITQTPGTVAYNLGTGQGYSVLEMVKAFAAAADKPVPYKIVARRPGDAAQCYADPALAAEKLGWRAELGLERMMEDTWRWQSQNPQGYRQ